VNLLSYIPIAAGLGVIFVASLARRGPIRLPRRSTEEGRMRLVHRGIVVHLALSLSCASVVVTTHQLSATGVFLVFGGIVLFRALGERIGRMYPQLGNRMGPLLAPVDGAALLVEWVVSIVLPRNRTEPKGGPYGTEAYDHVVELEQRTVESVMTPRSEMVWLRSEAELPEIIETVTKGPHARYPVFAGDFEQLVGTVELVDLLETDRDGLTAARMARPAVAVPETIGCDDLLERMRTDRFGTAIVVDEFGGIAGLVTLEDLLEVLVGELIGEHETVQVRARRLGEGSFLLDGSVRIDDFQEMFGVALPGGDYETVAGLFLSRVVKIPSRGERVTIGNLKLEVLEADTHRILKLKLVILEGLESSRSG